MNLNIFNPWRDLTTWSGITIQYQSTKKGGAHITYLRDKESNAIITYGTSRVSRDEALARAKSLLKRIGIDGVKRAIQTGKPVLVAPEERHVHNIANGQTSPRNGERQNAEWRDGIGHSHRAQRDLIR